MKKECPICCSLLLDTDEQVACPHCSMVYHKDCWEQNGGCAVYGCESTPHRIKNAQDVNMNDDGAIDGGVSPGNSFVREATDLHTGVSRQAVTVPPKSYFDVYLHAIVKWRDFSGRSSRKEWFCFTAFYFLFIFLLSCIPELEGVNYGTILVAIYGAILFPAWLAVSIRRTHDTNNSGWSLLFPPHIIALAFTAGTDGYNNYGEPSEI